MLTLLVRLVICVGVSLGASLVALAAALRVMYGSGRPVCVINDSDRLDFTHSITPCLTHRQLIHYSETPLPHLTTDSQPQTTVQLDSRPALGLKLLLFSPYS